jgi:hypothetical protein
LDGWRRARAKPPARQVKSGGGVSRAVDKVKMVKRDKAEAVDL